jgi:hypothetical protein
LRAEQNKARSQAAAAAAVTQASIQTALLLLNAIILREQTQLRFIGHQMHH